MRYLNRTIDGMLDLQLQASGAVLIEGPKWCGKTTTAKQKANSILEFQDPSMRAGYLETAKAKPELLLRGETPRLLDEWQDAPMMWDAVRVEVDRRQEMGQFILTGSNSVDGSQIFHSGTGRIARMKMYPMSLWESQESNGEISLMDVFNNPQKDIEGISNLDIEQLIFAVCRGGWPASLNAKSDNAKLLTVRNYYNSLCKFDISHIDGVARNEKIARNLLKSYARNVSTLAKKQSILDDIKANNESITMPTLDDYLSVLEKLFVIEDVDAWCPSIRSKTAIRSGVKRDFVDPSVAAAALGLTPESLQLDLRTFGFLFENLCVRDLRAYSQAFDGHVSYYHDRYGLEADVVLHLCDGRYALMECKLGSHEIEEGAKHLLELRSLVVRHNETEPQAPIRVPDLLMVITGGQYAYRRPDGVYVVPIGCLKN